MEEMNKDAQEEAFRKYVTQAFFEGEDADAAPFAIDWGGLARKVLNRWKFIGAVAFGFALVGAVFALCTPKRYTVNVTLAPELQGRSSTGGSLNGLASMLGLGGMNLGSSTDALSVTLYPEIIQSTPFLMDLCQVQVNPQDSVSSVLLFDFLQGKGKKSIFSFLSPNGEREEEGQNLQNLRVRHYSLEERTALGELSQSIRAEVDKKTGVTTLTVTMTDPQIATQVADTVCSRLQEYVTSYRTQKAKVDLDYYDKLSHEAREKMIRAQQAYAHRVDYDRSVILQSVNSERDRLQTELQLATQIFQQMEAQKEAAKAKYQELKPVFATIQPAVYPAHPSSTSRKVVVLTFAFVGGSLAVMWVLFISDIVRKIRSFIRKG